MNGVGFRVAKERDETILEEMLFHALYVPPGAEPFPRSILCDPALKAYTERWGRVGDDGLIALDVANGNAIGAIWTRLFSSGARGYGFIDEGTPELSIAVIPDRRGCGIGSELLRRLLGRLDETHSAVSLSVSAGNPATRLYVRHGFETIESSADSLKMLRRAQPLGGLL